MSSKRLRQAWAAAILLVAAPLSAGADTLEQQTKDLLVLHRKYLSAGAEERAALLPRLEAAATLRAETMRETLKTAPAALLAAALPADAHAGLPPSIQRHLEQRVTREGTIDGARADPFPFALRDRQGRRMLLAPVTAMPPLTLGASARIEGVLFDDILFFRPSSLTPLSRSGSDRQAPQVAISSPAAGAAVAGRLEITVNASDDTRLREVQLFRDGKTLGRSETAPARFSWDTRLEADGPHTLTAQATDPDLNSTTTPALAVIVDNTPPRVRLTAPEAGSVLAAVTTLSAQAEDAIGLAAVKFLIDGRVIATLVKEPYAASWDTAGQPNGAHTLTAHAVDRAGNETASAAVTVKLMNTNRKAPRLLPLTDRSVHEGSTLAFKILANDPDGPDEPLTYTAENLPAWASFDAFRQEFSGMPGFDVATHDQPAQTFEGLRFKACDPQPLCDEQAMTITVVNVNRPPIMARLSDQTVLEGQPLTVTPVVTDPDGDALRCEMQGAPAWLTLNPATCVVTGTPGLQETTQDYGGKLIPAIGVQACDPLRECVSQVFSLRLLNSNQRPALQFVGDHEAEEGRSLRLPVQAGDADSPQLKLEVTGLPDGAQFRDLGRGRGELSWTPRADQSGTYEITVTADDGRQTDAETLTVTVREKSLAIAGCIQDEQDRPTVNATITYGVAGQRQREARTDAKGCYLLQDLRPGAYTIRPSFRVSDVPTGEAVFFDPLSRRVELTTQDVRDINFACLRKDEY